jgi:hypothetical protein
VPLKPVNFALDSPINPVMMAPATVPLRTPE